LLRQYEIVAAWVSAAIGLFVAALLSPWNRYFLGNLAEFWLPHAVMLFVLLALRCRPGVIAGVALVLACYLAAYAMWVQSLSGVQGLVWLGYTFSLPGAAIGALVGFGVMRERPMGGAAMAMGAGVGFTFVGLAMNQALICSTLMHCGW